MFTGIIEETGTILAITNKKVTVEANKVLKDIKLGDSIAVNGVCLTVTEISKNSFSADISSETFKITSFKILASGNTVNLERAMPINGRFGGHIVLGHIDGVGKVKLLEQKNEFYKLEIELQPSEAKYVVKKGSVTINGISLTVADIKDNSIKIAIIPHTFKNTALKELRQGDIVNVETDITAKYIEKFLSTSDNSSGISLEFLTENGF